MNLVEKTQGQEFYSFFDAFPSKINEDFLLAGEFHGFGGNSCSPVLEFVKFINLCRIEAWAKDLDAVVNTASDMHFIHNIKSPATQLSDIVDHGQFKIDLLNDAIQVSVPG